MNEYLGMLLDGNVADQLQSEGVHLAFVVIGIGANIVVGIIGYLLLRAIKRNDEDQTKLGTEVKRVEGKVDANDRRHGYEIADIKLAVAPLYRELKLDQPEYPSR